MRLISQFVLLLIFYCQAVAGEVVVGEAVVGEAVVDELSGEEVNCSSILDYVQSYLELSTMDHTLLAMSAGYFQSKAYMFFPEAVIPEKPSSEDLETFKSDIDKMVHIIRQNQQFLVQKSDIIREVLPNCLR